MLDTARPQAATKTYCFAEEPGTHTSASEEVALVLACPAPGGVYLGVRKYGRANNKKPHAVTAQPTASHRALCRCAP
jgi:hypothetical protein